MADPNTDVLADRARIRSILTCNEARGREALAIDIATGNHTMGLEKAIEALKSTPRGERQAGVHDHLIASGAADAELHSQAARVLESQRALCGTRRNPGHR